MSTYLLIMTKKASNTEISQRAERIQRAIKELSQKITEIETEGEVAPKDCYVARYQASGQNHRYWYYQLKAREPIFAKANKDNEYSRFQHLGSSGSKAHIDGVLAVVRRVQIEELKKTIEALKQSFLDLYSNEEKVGHRAD